MTVKKKNHFLFLAMSLGMLVSRPSSSRLAVDGHEIRFSADIHGPEKMKSNDSSSSAVVRLKFIFAQLSVHHPIQHLLFSAYLQILEH